MFIAVPATIVVLISLYWVKIMVFQPEIPLIIAYQAPQPEATELLADKVKIGMRRPTAPSRSTSRVLASQAYPIVPLPEAVPLPEFDFGDIEGELGSSVGFGGREWTTHQINPPDLSEVEPDTGSFGNLTSHIGGLWGRLYDFKQDRSHKPNEEYLQSNPASRQQLYADYVNSAHRQGFSEASFEPYFQAPAELTLQHLAISLRPASEAPRYYGAEDVMDPQVWMAHYQGTVIVPETGTYRFAGVADDYLSLFIDNQPQLIACWPTLQPLVEPRWRKGKDSHRWATPINDLRLMFGRWIPLKKGQRIKIDLGIGERPGGELGYLLLVQKRREKYATAPDGRPILPLFTVAPFSEKQETLIRESFPNFSFEWDKVPIFSTPR